MSSVLRSQCEEYLLSLGFVKGSDDDFQFKFSIPVYGLYAVEICDSQMPPDVVHIRVWSFRDNIVDDDHWDTEIKGMWIHSIAQFKCCIENTNTGNGLMRHLETLSVESINKES